MKFIPIPLKGAYIIELEKKGDERGFFGRTYCEKEFQQAGLDNHFVQINNSLSSQKGTLRGMHYQMHPHSETKIVRCIKGALYDVVLDLNTNSPTFGQSYGVELSDDNRKMMYVPKGFAHGFLTIQDETEAFYLVSEFYAPQSERGIRWNDPKFGIKWPFDPVVVSDKDKNHPLFDPLYHLGDR